ncbi:MAG: RNA polymerase sigma factor [Bacteroidota bacterium]
MKVTTNQFFNAKVAELTNPLYRFAFWKTGSKEVSEEIVQDTFLKLWEKGNDIKAYKNLNAFAFKIIRNLCIDHHRKVKLFTTDIEGKVQNQINSNTPETELELKEKINNVDRAIKQLPENQQMVFFLRNIEACSIREISEKLDMKPNTVEVTLSRARKNLRRILNQYELR